MQRVKKVIGRVLRFFFKKYGESKMKIFFWNGQSLFERRTQVREKVRIPCVFVGLLNGERINEMARVMDLTGQGMYIESKAPLDEGTEIKAQIKSTLFRETFWVMGKVLRSTAKGMAIRFADPVPREVEMILTTR